MGNPRKYGYNSEALLLFDHTIAYIAKALQTGACVKNRGGSKSGLRMMRTSSSTDWEQARASKKRERNGNGQFFRFSTREN